jgi:hypothetical protein
MLQALEAENVTELLAARAEHNDLYGRAKVALGAGVVHEHVRAAWAQVQTEWPVERFEAETAQGSARIAGRAQSTEFRALLGDTLMRQMQLNQIVAEAEHAGRAVYGPNGEVVVPMSTRVGAGIMAAIEVVRIGLDIVGAYKQGAAATEARTLRTARQGIATVNWWLTIGVEPTVSLATVSSWDQSQLNVVDVPPARAMDAARGGSTEGLPDFDAVVVTGLPGDQLLHVLHRAIAELSTLQDWYTFNRSHPGGDAFRRFDEGWGVRMFSIAAKEYRYTDLEELAPGAVAALDPLITQLEQASTARMDDAVAAAGGATSVEDTAWIFGHDRRVDIYTPGGNPRRIDFDDVQPRFVRVSTVANPPGLDGPQILVRAADVQTYRRLAAEYWVEDTGRLAADESGTHHELQVGPNVQGYAFVEPDQLIRA